MKTSSEERARNYEWDMPRSAPGWLKEWAEAREWPENALLFKCDWLRDPMTGIRSKAARCRCTACGKAFWLDWVSGGMCRYGGAGGIRLWEDRKVTEVTDWQSCRCPECGEEVKARHLRSGSEYAGETAFPMTLHRIPVEGDKDRRRVIQNRGKRNCDRTPEVEAFERTWIAWVRAGARRDKAGAPVIPEKNMEKTKEDAA